MKRRMRRVLLLVGLAAVAGVVNTAPPANADVCAFARVWHNWQKIEPGDCVDLGGGAGCVWDDVTWTGNGVGFTVCAPVPVAR